MAASDINASGSSDLAATVSAPQTVTAPSSNSGSSSSFLGELGSLGSDLGGLFTGSSTLSSVGSDLSSLLGNSTFDAGALVGLGEYEAGQAQKQTAGLTSQLTTPAQPFVSGANTELSQTLAGLTGNGTAPPAGSSIAQQEQAAKELGDVATQYGTGQLTSAQQQQVQQYIQSQQQEIRSQLASQGVTDSSVLTMYDEQIQNNAAQLTQQLTAQNLGISEQALTSVQSTYNTLLNQSISQFSAGMGPIEDAVNLTVQQNTAIAGELNSLFGQIARGMSGASGGSGGGRSSSGGGSSGAGTLGTVAKLGSDLYSWLNGGDTLSAFGSQAASGTAAELGSAAAPAIAADTASALAPAVGAAPTAAELGTTADALAPFATSAAPEAASAAAPAASAAAPAASSSLGTAASAAGALAIPAAIFASYESTNPVNESAAWWQGLLSDAQSSDPNTANQAKLTIANDYLNGGGDFPLTQAQMSALGITPQYLASISQQITSPSPGGKGWLGGGYTGASRV
jgi:hypothetical protein